MAQDGTPIGNLSFGLNSELKVLGGEVIVQGSGVTYRMRGYETALMKHVYWNSSSVDSAGADYPGNSGNLTDVGVQRTIGG
jgi:hypothetical protein